MLTADETARLARRAALRRADGSRGLRARRAWRRLLRACAEGEPAGQDAMRTMAADLPEDDALDLLAAAPEEPADRAAYLALIGQQAQRQALDPEGSLLALAYRAAAAEVRERLRTVLAAEGDAEVVRVVVTGDRRERMADLSPYELDYLGHQLAEHGRWDELRRLVRDLPPARAAATVRLLPVQERTGNGANLFSMLADRSSEQLSGTVDRLPRDRLTTRETGGSYLGVSLSPDATEVALRYGLWKRGQRNEVHVETLRIGTGQSTHRFCGNALKGADSGNSILHLGDEVLVNLQCGYERHQVFRVVPDLVAFDAPSPLLSDIRRSSGGAVLVRPGGLSFVDPGARTLRRLGIPGFNEGHGLYVSDASCALTTLPEDRLVAVFHMDTICVVNENGTVLHKTEERAGGPGGYSPALSFLSAHSLVLHKRANTVFQEITEVWEFPSQGAPRRTARHAGAITARWPYEKWRGRRLDDLFVQRVYNTADVHAVDPSAPWIQYQRDSAGPPIRRLLAASPGGDLYFTEALAAGPLRLEIHSPHLPDARALLEKPLLHSTPQDLRHLHELRPKIGDPAVRDALDLLGAALSERFGGDIALGDQAAAPVGTATDIALGRVPDKQQGDT
ncbi:hypothetical protein [Streptomyces thinghirensis]|uniref:Uncharacterized protein n=1 Tax=Streptomyces thinghirensis TaxID=551547 RepID=A0ABP9TEC2_9ACTN